MTAAISSRAAWRKSSYSGANGNCVEVACHTLALVSVRDSRDPAGPMLTLTPTQWRAFTTALKRAPRSA
jgi:hypothetical protein